MASHDAKRVGRTLALAATLLVSSIASLATVPSIAGAAGSTSSTTTLSSSAPTGSALGQAVTYTATVAPTGGSGATPTGTVAFTDGGSTIAGCSTVTLVAATSPDAIAQCTPSGSAMSAGSHAIVASYTGDSTYAASISTTLTQTVARATTSTVVTSSPASPSPYGVAVTYTATVTAGGGVTSFTPTGTVSFSDGASVLCATAALSAESGGVAAATCTEPAGSMTIGTHPITTVYSGDANFTAGTGGSLSQTVVTDSTATVLGAVPASPSGLGVAVTYTATVTAGNGVTTDPTGAVTFKDGSTVLCTPTVSTTATPGVVTATCTEPGTSMTGGTHSVSAVYAGDANFATSTSTTLSQVVTPAATTTVVASSGNNSAVGQSVTYTATVTPTVAPFTITGTVAFKDNGTTIAGCSAQTVSAGSSSATATCTEPAASMTLGSHPITAVYGATTNYATSTSSALTQTVVQGTTSTSVTSSANPTSGGLAITYTATVAVAGGTAITPTGTVTFSDDQPGPGTVVLCSAAAFNGTTATCSVPAAQQTTGTHTITAVYTGDANFTGSTGTLAQVVTAAANSIAVSADPASPSGLGIGVDYTVTVSADNGSTLVPGKSAPGTVTVTDTAPDNVTSTLCTLAAPQSTAPGASTWECAEPAANMTAGAHTITVSFSGDSYFAASSTIYTQNVNTHPTGSTTAVASPGSPSYVGDPVTYTASVNGDSLFAPAGTVAFYADDVLLPGCSAVPPGSTSGAASTYQCTEAGSQMPVGTQHVYAVFSGDSNYGGSSSATITQVVSMGATTTTVGDTSGTADPSLAGIPAGYTATITPSQSTAIEPTGTVVFYDNGSPIAGCTAAPVIPGTTNSTATCTEPSLSMLVGSHLITAVYSGDGNYITSDDIGAPFNQQVGRNTTTTAVVGPGSGSFVTGQPVGFTATVTAAGVGLGNQLTPTGTVTFSDSSGSLCTVPVTPSSPGVATASCVFSSANFTVTPTDLITATYNADSQYTGSAGSTDAPAFAPAPTNATIASSTSAHPTHGNASVVDAPVTYVTSYSDPNGGLVNPTGTVTYTDTFDGTTTTICTVPLVQPTDPTTHAVLDTGTSTAACTETADMAVGTHHITATYSGDANYTTVTSPETVTWDQIVVADDATITLTSPLPANSNTFPANNVVYSVYTPVTLQATLTSLAGTTPFTANGDGGVTFYMNGVAINPANFPTAPNGAVTPDCTDMPVTASPTATVTCAGFPMLKGSDRFTVAYLDSSGQAGYNSDLGSTAYTWQVVYFATNTQVISNPVAPVTGQAVTLTAAVTPSSGAAQLPTGTLTFSVNGTPVTCASPATLDDSNPPVASCTLPDGLPGGADVVQATYPGDSWYAASIGSLSMTVGQAATTTNDFTVTTSTGSTSPVSGQTLKFSVGSVTPVAPGVGTPTGTVTITTPSTAKTLCVITLVNAAGNCYDSSIQIPSGSPVSFTATYSGDSGFTTSSATTAVNVAPETALVTSIVTSPTTVTYGQPMTYTVTLAPQFPGTVTTGTVALTAYTSTGPGAPSILTTLCTITLTSSSNNTGSCTFTPSAASGFLPTGADKFTATYSGDANFASGTTGTTTAFVNRSTVTTSVTVNPQNPVYGQLPSFAITVTPAVSGTTPTGTVQILSSQTGLTPLCTYTLATVLTYGSVVGSCTATQLLVAQNNVTFTAVYSGDANFANGTGTTLTNIQKATTTTTVTPTTSNPTYGQPQSFTVTVAPQVAGVTPTGTVTITTPGVLQPLCTVTLSGGAGSCTTTLAVPTGSGIVYQASYAGDSNFLASTGLSSANTVGQTTAGVALSLSTSSSAYGSEASQVFTATVTSPTTGTPTGTVTISSGATTICTVTLAGSGGTATGTCSPGSGTLFAPSSLTVAAAYSGDTNFAAPSTAPTKAWTITKAVPVMTTGVSTSTVIYGNESQASLTATVASPGSGTPTGSVTFKNGGTLLCTATLVNGTGSCTPAATALAASGTAYSLTAAYAGDGNFSAPASQTVHLTVSQASTTATMSVSPGTVTYGSETSSTVTVTEVPQFAGTPTGTVAISAGATTLCAAATLNASGIATCAVSTQTLLPVGSYTVVSTYAGDTNFSASSTFGFLTVTQASTATTLAVSPTSVALGHENTVDLTPTLTPTPTSAGTPTGSVTITATNTSTLVATVLCTVSAAQATGAHSCSPAAGSVLATGSYNLVASYPGDPNFAASASSAGSLTVTPASAGSLTLALTASGTTVTYGNESAVTYNVNLGSAIPTPTGTVTVATDGTTLCTVTLAAGAGSCSISSPTLLAVSSTNPVVATYDGDANYSGTVSSTAAVNLAVVKAPTTTGFTLSSSVVTFGAESATVITGTVTPGFTYGAATGLVTITSGATTLCSFTLVTASANTGSCSPSDTALTVTGSPFSLTATYAGDPNFVGSVSSAQTLTVIPAVTTTTLTETPASVVVGQETSVTFTPVVQVAPVAAGAPTGSVTVTATNAATHVSSVLCSMPAASATGTATCSPASAIGLAPGTYSLSASYPGDPNFTASSGTAAGVLTVVQAPASGLTLGLTPSGTSTAYGNESAVTYDVSFGPAFPAPTGSVTITSGTTTLCTATLSAGSGSCAVSSPTLLPVSATNPVVATYGGDADYSGSVSSTTPVNLAVVQATTSIGISVVPAGVIYGSEHAALITATVTPAYAGTPTGTVAVTATPTGGGAPVPICTITLPGSTCTPSDTALPAGTSYDLTAAYSGDANFQASAGSDTKALTVSPAGTATSLVLSASTVQYGISPTFTAAVSPSTTGTPTGTVAIVAYVSGSPVTLCTIDLPSTTCVGTGTALATSTSPYSVIAVYSGDGNYTTSTSTSQNLTVTSNSTTTIAVLSPPSVAYGNESTAVVSVTVAHTGAGTPTGTVDVTYSGDTVCVITLSGGAGTCSPGNTDFAVGGPYFFTATYSGDSAYTGSSSTPVSLTVTQAATTPSVAAQPSSVTYGDLSSSVLTATVTPQYAGTPTGTVTFTSGGTSLCTVTLPTDTCTTPTGVQLPVGTHAVTASYSGDANFAASTATTPAVITVTQATSTTAVSVTPDSVAYGGEDAATFAVTVTPQYGGTATGSVTVSAGPTALCTVILTTTSAGTGTCATSALALAVGGPYDLTAVYSGDADVIGSTGTDPAALTVHQATTSTVAAVSPATATFGDVGAVQLSAQVVPAAAGTPTGTVTFTSVVAGISTTLCTAPVATLLGVTSASCSLPSTVLPASSTAYDVTATYNGDASFESSTGTTAAALTITQATTTTALTSSGTETTYGDESSVELSATVATPGAGDPTGTVTFSSDGTPLCTATVSAGTAACAVADTALDASPTAYPVTATYSGDTNFTGSSTTEDAQITVDQATTDTTIVSVSSPDVTYGLAGPDVTVSVAPQYAGTPTGTVTVTSGTVTLCTVTLPATTCEILPMSLPARTEPYDVTATYSGDTNFDGSAATSSGALTVDQAASTTTASVAPSSVVFGSEQAAVFTTTVAPKYAGTPTGTVTVATVVDGDPVVLCIVALPATTCSTTPQALPAGGPYPVTATYSGDANFTGSTVAVPGGLTVTRSATTTSVTSVSPSSVAYGSESLVTLTATVAPTAGEGTPTGTVTFTTTVSGAPVTLCSAGLTQPGGVGTPVIATCAPTDASLPASAAAYGITATYGGDTDFLGSIGTAPDALTVTTALTTTTITSSAQSAVYGDEHTVTLSATVASAATVPVPGTVAFRSGGDAPVDVCSAPVVDGAASCSVPDTALDASATPYDVVATYSGAADFAGSSDTAPGSVTVTPAATVTALTSIIPATVAIGTAGPTVSVSVAPQYGGSPTGSVAVDAVDTTTSATATLCSVTLTAAASGSPSTGSCTAGTVTLAAGTYDLRLVYVPGGANFGPSSTTEPTALTVTADTTTTAITSVEPSTVPFGSEQETVITARVTASDAAPDAPAPTGTVTITTPVGAGRVTVCTATLTQPGGVGTPVIASCRPTGSALTVGTYQLTATYGGDDSFDGSVSTTASLTVTEAAVTVAVTSSLTPSLPGRPVTFTATVTPVVNGFPTPTGTVRFVDVTSGATLCAAAAVTTIGGTTTATCTAIPPTTPTQQIVATYSGDVNYTAAQGTLTQQVQHGYWTVAKDGGVFAFGDARFFGSMGGKPLNQPVVGIAATADAGGYWLVANDGGVFAFGDAQFYGSMGNQHLNQPVVGIQPTRDGKGYWLVAADGGVFNYGDAKFYGSTGNLHLNSPIVGMVATDDGLGYFLVAADGGVFAFGDATFAGGGTPDSSSPIVGLAPTPSGAGYWLAAADGGVFSYGDAQFHGSMANQFLASPIVGTASTTDGGGYWLVAADGGVFAFGDAIFDGSTGNKTLTSPMVSMADI